MYSTVGVYQYVCHNTIHQKNPPKDLVHSFIWDSPNFIVTISKSPVSQWQKHHLQVAPPALRDAPRVASRAWQSPRPAKEP